MNRTLRGSVINEDKVSSAKWKSAEVLQKHNQEMLKCKF